MENGGRACRAGAWCVAAPGAEAATLSRDASSPAAAPLPHPPPPPFRHAHGFAAEMTRKTVLYTDTPAGGMRRYHGFPADRGGAKVGMACPPLNAHATQLTDDEQGERGDEHREAEEDGGGEARVDAHEGRHLEVAERIQATKGSGRAAPPAHLLHTHTHNVGECRTKVDSKIEPAGWGRRVRRTRG